MSAPDIGKIVREAAAEAMRGMAPELVADINALISVPVGRIGGRTIRSRPGEPPRLDTGNLRASNASSVDADALRLTAYNTAPYAATLEFDFRGIGRRPYYSTVFADWQDKFPSLLASGMAAKLK